MGVFQSFPRNRYMGMEDVVEFCKLVGHLKHLPRTGWLYKDTSRCMKMALVHDLGESIIENCISFTSWPR
ncbi:5'-deoxynucleotidase HDDC2 [Trichinella spiralis]|uniref:5'-deoxynucleotidase HDDC2 n=1 Tax=Trichinella spiralis TaxID=6334 RepID=A0ABR3KEI8_TRISP